MTGFEIVLSTLLSVTSVSLLVLFAEYNSLKNQGERDVRELLILHEKHNSLNSSTSKEMNLLKEQINFLKEQNKVLKDFNRNAFAISRLSRKDSTETKYLLEIIDEFFKDKEKEIKNLNGIIEDLMRG